MPPKADIDGTVGQSGRRLAPNSSQQIAKGRRWLDELVAGTVTDIEQIAARDGCSIRQVNMTISLAFLAPTLVSAAIEGRLPRGVGVAMRRSNGREVALLGLAS